MKYVRYMVEFDDANGAPIVAIQEPDLWRSYEWPRRATLQELLELRDAVNAAVTQAETGAPA